MLAEPVMACPPWGCRSLEKAPTSGPWRGPQGLAGASMLAGATWRAGRGRQGCQRRTVLRPHVDGLGPWVLAAACLLALASALPTFVATARVPGAVAAGGRSLEPLLDGCCAVSHGVLDLVLRGKRALSPAPVPVEARRVEEGVVDQCATVSSLRSRSARASGKVHTKRG
jgi:hypothetical protein